MILAIDIGNTNIVIGCMEGDKCSFIERLSTVRTTEHQSSSYIGNRSSHVFHRPSCANLPLEKNRIYFANRSDAVTSGYTPCSKCKP